jgi:hypothetical protein
MKRGRGTELAVLRVRMMCVLSFVEGLDPE